MESVSNYCSIFCIFMICFYFFHFFWLLFFADSFFQPLAGTLTFVDVPTFFYTLCPPVSHVLAFCQVCLTENKSPTENRDLTF